MSYVSLMVDVREKMVIVAGGDRRALALAEKFLQLGAFVTLWSTDLHPDYQALQIAYPKKLNILNAEFLPDIANHYCQAKHRPFLVVSCLYDDEIDNQLAELCRENGVLFHGVGIEDSETILPLDYKQDRLNLAVYCRGADRLAQSILDSLRHKLEKHWRESPDRFIAWCLSDEVDGLEDRAKRYRTKLLAEELVAKEGDFDLALQALADKLSKQSYDEILLQEYQNE